jgi:hypothetical protein
MTLAEDQSRTSLSKLKTLQKVQRKRKSFYMCYYLLCLLLHFVLYTELSHAMDCCLGRLHDSPLLSAAKLAANVFLFTSTSAET